MFNTFRPAQTQVSHKHDDAQARSCKIIMSHFHFVWLDDEFEEL